jgi:mono/diheme cytochrome c family protein
MNTISAISYQVINGKNGMPAFGGRLKEEIEVATYVLQRKQNFQKELKIIYLVL